MDGTMHHRAAGTDDPIRPPYERRLFRLALMVTFAASALAGCSGPGAAVAERIRASGSPLIERVGYAAPSPFGQPERVVIDLKSDTTEEQAIEFWCAVVKPAGGEDVYTIMLGGHDVGVFSFTSYPGRPDIPDCAGRAARD